MSEEIWNKPIGWKMKTPASPIRWRRKAAEMCWHILNKLGAVSQFMYSEKVYTYGIKEQKEITAELFEMVGAILDGNERVEDYCIVLGGKEFGELMGCYESFELVTVPMGDVWYQRDGYKARFQGIPIHVVPSVSGAAAIPKVIVEKRK
jgi:hypothetical protein